MSETLRSLAFVVAGFFGLGATLYVVMLTYRRQKDIPAGIRRFFTFFTILLWYSLMLDYAVVGILGGPIFWLSNGGAEWPVRIIVTGRVLIGVFILAFVAVSIYSWRPHSDAKDQ